ncbi:MAG: YihY/virulence factor BrkB family protein [Candidatus Marinimicrobia bacterium]|nr:YihY/virulence factor BrkB family protein [Candidatus Neomarinimicrobiota bacterium]
MKDWQARFERLRRFLAHDIWVIEVSSPSAWRARLARVLRILSLATRGFRDDDITTQASSLTFATCMSLVPLLAIAFAVLRGLGAGADRIGQLMEWQAQMPPEFQQFLGRVLELVDTTNFAAMGWIGVGILIFMAAMVLGKIEKSVNRIWGITNSRGILRQLANYISILVVVPILIGIASTVMATLSSETLIARLGSAGFMYRASLRSMPLLATWIALSFLYAALPNTRVRAVSALVGGLFGAILWLAWQKAYIMLQVGVARHNAIYGTFSAIPIFLAWMYIGWLLILLGAEVTFAIQNESTFHLERAGRQASPKARASLALSLLTIAAEAQQGRGEPLNLARVSQRHRVPIRLLNEVIALLVNAQWLAPVAEQNDNFILTRTPEKLSLGQILDLFLEDGYSSADLHIEGIRPLGGAALAEWDRAWHEALAPQTLADCIEPEGNARQA